MYASYIDLPVFQTLGWVELNPLNEINDSEASNPAFKSKLSKIQKSIKIFSKI